jgi:hypothetical protein
MKRKRTNVVFGLIPPCDGKCGCRTFLLEWASRLSDEETVWSLEDIQGIDTMIFANLCCVACRCTDEDFREYARSQLRDEHWDAQKQRDGLTLN